MPKVTVTTDGSIEVLTRASADDKSYLIVGKDTEVQISTPAPPTTTPTPTLGVTNQRSGMGYPGLQGVYQAAAAALDGDTLLVLPGLYKPFAITMAKTLTLKCSVPGGTYSFDGNGSENRIIELGMGVGLTLEDAELQNNKTEWGNQAGVWPTGGAYTLTLRRCKLHDLGNGVLCGEHPLATVLIEDCDIWDNGDYNGLSHNLYIGHVASFTMRRCKSYRVKQRGDGPNWAISWGHLVKSRAEVTVIEDCSLLMGHSEANRCIDLPNGGDVSIKRCKLEFRTPQNNFGGQLVSFGVEQKTFPVVGGIKKHSFVFEDNTCVNRNPDSGDVSFLWIMDADPVLYSVKNNIFAGPHMPAVKGDQKYAVDMANNKLVALTDFVDLERYDWRLKNPAPVWTKIADENANFTVPANTTVRYGANGKYITKVLSGAGSCSNTFFGSDPLVGFVKTCEASNLAPIPAPTPVPTPTPTPNGKWTPAKDASGNVLQSEWDAVPKNTWVEWMGTSFESQLSPPYGAAAGYKAPGNSPIYDHYGGYTGMGFNDGDCYHFGGGHDGSGFNALSMFSASSGKHSIVIPPTHQSMFPANYTSGYSWVNYPNASLNYFSSTQSPKGDNAPAASHEWGGIVYIPGINEVLLPRFGWFHAMLDSKTWKVGPQTTEANRKGWVNRGGIALRSYYLPSTGLVYLTSESGQLSGTESGTANFVAVAYDPVKRQEVGTVFIGQSNWLNNGCLEGDVLWIFRSEGSEVRCSQTNLKTSTNLRNDIPCKGRLPAWGVGDGENPVQYIPELDKLLMWCTTSRIGGAQAGEMLEIDRTTLEFKLFPIQGTPPATEVNMNNKFRYWPKHRVLLFQLATNRNACVIRL